MANSSRKIEQAQPSHGFDGMVTASDDGTLTTTSIIIADGVGNQHKNVLSLIQKNLADFEDFGSIAFETRVAGQSHNPTRYAVLNREHAMFAMTLFRNNSIVVAFKKRLIHAFVEMEQKLRDTATTPFEVPQSYAAALRVAADAEDRARQSDEKLHRIAVAVHGILDEDTSAIETETAAPVTTLFQIEPHRPDASMTPATFFIADYVAERQLTGKTARLAVNSLSLAASNEYERLHGERPPRTYRTIMGKPRHGNAYTDADRPMLDALWNRAFRGIGDAA
ncbi:MAG: Rha family transcriptional regulator [Acidipropionibacterium jensenii]|uniref:Rha family transcriptional regulator n=1 Tax=Corynebacterium variabile TaxID=1727 RepID=UPI00264A09F8|nr:Rha family transcriptional regulator [Corynebacterium variabile]MDN6658453.1 Rha family transcriptional regulator [Acidipropionibacterium jensenii]MDN6676160.1 Rha family transcriptional regulator [Corynebacterium variabile]